MTRSSFIFLICTALLLFYSAMIEPQQLNVSEYQIKNEYLSGIRVAFLSDFYLKRNETGRLAKILKRTVAQNPDIIILGGDYLKGSAKNNKMVEVMARNLNHTNARVYAIFGEADIKDKEKLRRELQDNGVTVLEDANARALVKGKYFDIVGVNDFTQNPNVSKAFNRTIDRRIVISHNPDIYYSIIDDADIILAGHTLGGQFVLPFTPPIFVASKFGSLFAAGISNENRNIMVVSKGLGTGAIPFRFQCAPEIIIIDFVQNTNNGDIYYTTVKQYPRLARKK